MDVKYTQGALRQLQRMDKLVAIRIYEKVEWFAIHYNEVPHKVLKGEFEEMYKLRVGDWRVIYSIEHINQNIVVHQVGHRGSIYN